MGLDLANLTESMAKNSPIIENKDGFAVIIQDFLKVLLTVFGRVPFEQVWANTIMDCVHLIQQLYQSFYISFIRSSYHCISSG
jgi:hypothetical protein